jgi:glycosyltransferase involved in cell wall biosynthesis
MKHSPKISFVIPVYNRADMVLEALQSLINQTIPDWEAIVVDDHSTDNLAEALNGCDERIHYAILPNKRGSGAACARNYGNLLARGELIAVLDSDDLATPDRAERAIQSYQKYKWDFYCTYRETVGTTGQPLTIHRVLPEKWDGELFKTQSYVTHSTVVYTRKSALDIPYNSALSALEDYDLITRFIESGKKMYLDTHITTIYRKHEGERLTTHTNGDYQTKLLHAIRTWRDWEDEDPNPDKI